jgi:hypothetical protein
VSPSYLNLIDDALMPLSLVTRRDVLDYLRTAENFLWWGRLEEITFLRRLYQLATLPSHDYRYQTAEEDIRQHRVNNYDWDDYWVFDDPRFGLANGPDEVFLEFLAQMVHPLVQPEQERVEHIVEDLNELLARDGWSLTISGRVSGRPVYAPARVGTGATVTLGFAHKTATRADSTYISQQVTRMEGAIDLDPELAIGTAKEFLETIAKTILDVRKEQYTKTDDLPVLIRKTIKALELRADDVPPSAPSADIVRRVLMNLAAIAQGSAELRNAYGTGHGKTGTSGLRPRHARLAVGAAITLGTFLYETHEERDNA